MRRWARRSCSLAGVSGVDGVVGDDCVLSGQTVSTAVSDASRAAEDFAAAMWLLCVFYERRLYVLVAAVPELC